MDIENSNHPIIIAYYPFRAKAQISRLLCEFLHLPYKDRFFNPDQWSKFKENQAKNWIIRDLPFLQDEDFIATGPLAMATYIIEKVGKREMFGCNPQDKAKIDSLRTRCDLGTLMIAAKCTERPNSQVQSKHCMGYYWQKKIKPILNIFEQECKMKPWFFGYITIVDFVVYEIVNQMEKMFSKEIGAFKKLVQIHDAVAAIPQIRDYEKSSRAVYQYCPIRYFDSFRQQKLNKSRSGSSTSSRSSHRDMDLE